MIELDGETLTAAAIAEAAHRSRTPVQLSPAARLRIESSHRAALALAQHRLIYGRSTGVGANRDVTVDDAEDHARSLLRSHATSAGAFRSAERVRGMVLVRLNQLAAGGSGASPELADALVAMLNADALPAVREHTGIGTGDIAALAAVGLALIGEAPTSSPLGFQVPLSEHDALPLLSSNAATLADAAIACAELQAVARACVVVAALTFVAVQGNAEAFSDHVSRVTPFAGARCTARWMRSLLDVDAEPGRIQDPVSLRALPQVHGPFVDAVARLETVIERLVNAPSENPLIVARSTDGDEVVHHGGFHAAYLATALTTVAITAAQTGKLVVRRLSLLNEPAYTGLRPFLAGPAGGASGVMLLEYVAASALGELAAASSPGGLHATVLSRGVEDDASFASLAARQVGSSLRNLRIVVACEAVAAARALGAQPRPTLRTPLQAALQLCAPERDLSDRDLSPEIARICEQLPALAALLPVEHPSAPPT